MTKKSAEKKQKRLIGELLLKFKVFLGALVLCVALAVSVYLAERNAEGATIASIPEALWFTFTSISTIGYGDYIAVTAGGKIFTVLAYLCSRFALCWMVVSVYNNKYGKKRGAELTTADRLLSIENELKIFRSSVDSMSRDIHTTVRDNNCKKHKQGEILVNSVGALKDVASSPLARGLDIKVNYPESEMTLNNPEDLQIVLAVCREKGVHSLRFTDTIYAFN